MGNHMESQETQLNVASKSNSNLDLTEIDPRNKPLFMSEEVEKTPFRVQSNKEEEWWIIAGRYRFNEEPFKTKKEAIEDAHKITWEKIMQLWTVLEIGKEANDAN